MTKATRELAKELFAGWIQDQTGLKTAFVPDTFGDQPMLTIPYVNDNGIKAEFKFTGDDLLDFIDAVVQAGCEPEADIADAPVQHATKQDAAIKTLQNRVKQAEDRAVKLAARLAELEARKAGQVDLAVIDARINMLVSSMALQGNTTPWPASKCTQGGSGKA